MARRPAQTLLLIAEDRTVRADFAADGTVVHSRLWPVSATTASASSPAARAALALTGEPGVGRQVWVLWEDLWVQTLALPAVAIEGLPDDDLRRALAFEAEPLSGLSPLTCRVGHVTLPEPGDDTDRRRFVVALMTQTGFDDLAQAIGEAGGQLAGVIHPGGLPRGAWSLPSEPSSEPSAWVPPTDTTWQRVEVWSSVTMTLSGTAAGLWRDVAITTARPGTANWRAQLPTPPSAQTCQPIAWMARQPPPQTLCEDGLPLPWVDVSLEARQPPLAWLAAWRGVLTGDGVSPQASLWATVAVITPPPRPAMISGPLALGVAAMLVIAALCGWEAAAIRGQTQTLSAQTLEIQNRRTAISSAKATQAQTDRASAADLARHNQQLTGQLTALRKTISELDTRDRQLALALRQAQTRRAAWQAKQANLNRACQTQRAGAEALLGTLADLDTAAAQSPQRLVVAGLAGLPDGQLRLTGFCNEADDPDRLAETLTGRLAPTGWRVASPQRDRRDNLHLGAWTYRYGFTIELTPPALTAAQFPSTTPVTVPPTLVGRLGTPGSTANTNPPEGPAGP